MTVTLTQQIAAQKREIALRKNVLPKQVRDGRMRQGEADRHMAEAEAILETLLKIQAQHDEGCSD